MIQPSWITLALPCALLMSGRATHAPTPPTLRLPRRLMSATCWLCYLPGRGRYVTEDWRLALA